MRLLHARHAHHRVRASAEAPEADRSRDPGRARGEPLPVRRTPPHRHGGRGSGRRPEREPAMTKDVFDEYTRPGGLARRDFLKIAGGGIVDAVSFDELTARPQA